MELIERVAPTCENSAVKKPKGTYSFYTRWITLWRKTAATCSSEQIISYSHEKGGGRGASNHCNVLSTIFPVKFHNFNSGIERNEKGEYKAVEMIPKGSLLLLPTGAFKFVRYGGRSEVKVK